MEISTYADLPLLAQHLRDELERKKFILIYAYNGTGKTRLSGAFKDIGKTLNDSHEVVARDTLYFNAFTEDLFTWDNDLDDDLVRFIQVNRRSKFFDGLDQFELENRIRRLLEIYSSLQFRIDLENWTIHFSREVLVLDDDGRRIAKTLSDIKISRSEESIFLLCFFLAVVEIALDSELDAYNWVKYVYIDDPVSSLDEQSAVVVAAHLAHLLTASDGGAKVLVSTHHPLFHNVLWNELRNVKAKRYFLGFDEANRLFTLRDTRDTPFFHHVAELIRLHMADQQEEIEKRHFAALRAIAERTASFLGYKRFEDCVGQEGDELTGRVHRRFLNLFSHGGYAHFEVDELQEEDRQHFREIISALIERFRFNPELFPAVAEGEAEAEGDNQGVGHD
ncbi:MAG: anticodon nuclease [Alphaproteobacteria bacterium]|nr:MAG: anticodon nuclease [Alphaproteobacteria bacterium]